MRKILRSLTSQEKMYALDQKLDLKLKVNK